MNDLFLSLWAWITQQDEDSLDAWHQHLGRWLNTQLWPGPGSREN